ncbi:b5 type B [Seminavis robusta]|uniref:B5 type B n=1 Tax=Seminavis robusta TaxID=568900 RepID=A0A9N8HA52_9STRA|nr:b5 type B [Seminavis robusta]|eukprot:Sro229_g093080.1 b5 type B (440) ;mRNA; r:55963-57282
MDPQLHYDFGLEISQAVCSYAQLYIWPLVLMGILSVVTVYRREMSCNRVYYLQDGDPNNNCSREGDNHQSAADNGTSTISRRAASRLSWLQFDRGADPEVEQALLAGRAAAQAKRSARATNSERTALKWSRKVNMVAGRLAATLPQTIRTRLAESSFNFFPIHKGRRRVTNTTPLHPENFPSDVQVNIFSFLHPQDVARFACVSRASKELIDGQGPTTKALWKTLWQRDYGWLIQSWDVGRITFQRSNVTDPPFGKDFYFRFGLCHLDYLLAGFNSPERCLIGLHGCIFDITDFFTSHPGSPDTLLVHAGRDASKMFDDMDHSRSARRLAREFCISVDVSATGSFGSKPTIAFPADGPIPVLVEASPVISKKQRRMQRKECLQHIYTVFATEATQERKKHALQMKANPNVLDWNVFYDPFQGAWKAWYTNKRDFETVFV